jgi:hypothetical protein
MENHSMIIVLYQTKKYGYNEIYPSHFIIQLDYFIRITFLYQDFIEICRIWKLAGVSM